MCMTVKKVGPYLPEFAWRDFTPVELPEVLDDELEASSLHCTTRDSSEWTCVNREARLTTYGVTRNAEIAGNSIQEYG